MALWIAYYNLCRVHETLRCTPAMAAGLTDHIWSIGELLRAALDAPPTPAAPLAPTNDPEPIALGMSAKQASIMGPRRRRFRVINGGLL